MVYLLIVIQMVLSIISFLKGRKRIIYPPFVLNAAFLILGIVGLFCKYNISWVIVAFIGICNFVVTIIYSFLDRKKWSREKADLNKLNISNIKLGILYSIQIVSALSLILFFKNVMNITTFENITEYINNFNSDYELNYAKLLPIYIGILDNISFAITVVFTYALVKNYCLYNSKKEYVLMNYKLLGCYLLYIPIIMLMNKNFNVVVLFVLSFFTWFIICCKKNKLFNKKYIEIIFSLFLTAACCTFYLYISNKNNKILECLSIGLCVYIIFLFIKKVMFIEKIENRFREKQNIKKIQNADIVSFDLYDTLVNRITLKNEAVYKAVKKWCDKENIEIDPNYIEKRLKADLLKDVELKPLRELYKEVNIKGKIDAIMEVEENIEINVTYKNGYNWDLYKKAKELGKKIIITTDIHLSEETIRKILKKNNIDGFYKLYISSEVRKSKSSGNIFDYIAKDLIVNPKNIIHFGDNFISDLIKPRLNKWKSVFLDKRNKEIKDELEKFFEDKVKIDDKFQDTGYKTLGPLLYYYSVWLKKNIADDEEILFLSRDGKIMKEAYNIIYGEANTRYFYASRRAMIVPGICLKSGFEEIIKMYDYGKKLKISKFLYYMGLDNVKIENDEFYDIRKEETISKFFLHYRQNEKEIIRNSNEQRELFLEYIGNCQKINIVDIGWNGNMQNSIKSILGKEVEVNGYYIGTLNKEKNKKGFLFERKESDIHIEEQLFNSILEFIFSASHGSVSSYKREKGRIIPNLLEYENSSKEDTILNDVQRGAIMFVRDFNEINKYLHIDKTPEQAFSNLKKMFLKPTLKDANMWGELEFCDYEKKKIASPKSIWYYLVHPKRFVKEFRESWWRPGFIKRVFKVNLPYINLLKWYKRRKYNEK